MLLTTVLQAAFIVAISAAPVRNSTASAIRWGLCNETEVNGTLPMQCANLRVPLDYTDPSSNDTLELELARVTATEQPSRGTILLNFGGPGDVSRESLATLGPLLRRLSGGEYDLVAFDPRGTGNTIPFRCYDTELEAQTVAPQLGLFSNASEVALGDLWATGTVVSATCEKKARKIGELIGTPFVARDLISVVDALGEDGLLRYWGFSYGTTLGATVAAMFPDRIDKIIIDGVQNPHEYYHSLINFEEWTQSDYVFSSMFTACVATPQNCTLSKRNMTAVELEQATWGLLDQVKYEPIVVGETFIVDYNMLKGMILQSGHSINSWPSMTTIIDMLLNDEVPKLANFLPLVVKILGPLDTPPLEESAFFQSLLGIQCGDRTARASSLEEFRQAVDKNYNISKVFGDGSIGAQAICAHWKIEPKERYTGDFQAKTRGPMLVIGNTGDPLTPVVSARNVSAGFEGSEVLVVNGFGHASIAPASSCTLRVTTAFWANGTLPPPGTVCEVEGKPFSGITWNSLLGI